MKIRHFFLLTVFLLLVFVGWQIVSNLDLPDAGITAFGSENLRARVVEIIEDGEIDLGGLVQRYQVLRVVIEGGNYSGILMEMDYGKCQILPAGAIYLQSGDRVLVTVSAGPDGVLNVYFADFVRLNPLLWLSANRRASGPRWWWICGKTLALSLSLASRRPPWAARPTLIKSNCCARMAIRR